MSDDGGGGGLDPDSPCNAMTSDELVQYDPADARTDSNMSVLSNELDDQGCRIKKRSKGLKKRREALKDYKSPEDNSTYMHDFPNMLYLVGMVPLHMKADLGEFNIAEPKASAYIENILCLGSKSDGES